MKLIHDPIYIEQEFYDSDEAAYEEVRRGHAWGAMVFQSNYSESLVERTETGRYAEDWTIEASDVGIKLDMSSEYSHDHDHDHVQPLCMDELKKN